MELSETVESINTQLEYTFGLESSINKPMYRVVFSDEQREMRRGTYSDFTPSGIFIREVTEVREVPKYQWIKARYILERLVAIPEINLVELPATKLSYEVIWVFENQSGTEALPPRFDASKIIIDSLHAALGKTSLRKYVDPDNSESRKVEIDKLQQELFGNETPATDALAYGTGVSLSGPKFTEAMSTSPDGDKK